MICPDCGSYQPDSIKFCGICGVPLSTDGHISQFLLNAEDEGGNEIELPRRRGFLFYLTVILSFLVILALTAGVAFLIYYVTRTESGPETITVVTTSENVVDYSTPDGTVSFTYPRLWDLTEVGTVFDQLELGLKLTEEKRIDINSEMMDPDLMLGGMEDIRSFIADEITRDLAATSTSSSMLPPDLEQVSSGLLSAVLNGQTAYSYKAEIDVNQRKTTVYYYFIVSNELLYELRGTSPTDIWDETLPDYMIVVGTFRTMQAD